MTRLPWTIYRYLGRELLLTFLVCLASLSILFMIVSCFQAVHHNYSLRIVLPWVIDSSGYYMFFTVPVSLLFASTLVYGRFVADKEYTATASCGLSPLHVFMPVAILSLAITGIAFLTQGTVFPHANYKKRNIARYLLKELENLGQGWQRELPIEDGRVYCDYHDGAELRGVAIEKFVPGIKVENEAGELVQLLEPIKIIAASATVSIDSETGKLLLRLINVTVLFPHRDARREMLGEKNMAIAQGWETARFNEWTIDFEINEKHRRAADKTTAVLQKERREHQAEIAKLRAEMQGVTDEEELGNLSMRVDVHTVGIRKADVEIWLRRSLALSCFTFSFLAFPISLALRHRHRLQAFFLGVVTVVIFFYAPLPGCEWVVEHGLLPAPLAMMSGNLILMGIGAFLTGRLFVR